ncbi:uncharacterized protein MJAP1_002123 [Malassezia japonica]|uniref:Early meiotic induction protein 1 n=1 Tax=Malassezia japonica TaxID=223818 RepID=A0AAF0EXT9_9BASI|nr:uncharacterized protein MJAP1_002123 [Malassezia japonica]WFD39153.1 hypothetical protein MJAP1_002123 [Malassezia japonica]
MGAQSSRPVEAAPAPPRREFDDLVKEELALQAAATPADEIPSCLTLFDKWLSCYALGVQFRNAYRYGTIADCAPRREDFKFCLTLRQLDPEMRRHEWLLRRAEERAHQRKGFHTSEAVWEMRRDPLLDPHFVDEAYVPPQ